MIIYIVDAFAVTVYGLLYNLLIWLKLRHRLLCGDNGNPEGSCCRFKTQKRLTVRTWFLSFVSLVLAMTFARVGMRSVWDTRHGSGPF